MIPKRFVIYDEDQYRNSGTETKMALSYKQLKKELRKILALGKDEDVIAIEINDSGIIATLGKSKKSS